MSASPFVTEDAARRAVIDACLRMNALGINHGKAGNVSVRWSRGAADGYLITPSAVPYESLTEDDIVWLPLGAPAPAPAAGELFESAPPPRRTPSTEWRMHRLLYERGDGPAAGAVVHAHSSHATTLACLPRVQQHGIPPFHYMIAVAGGHDIRCASYATFGSEELAAAIGPAIAGRNACLIANHGLLVCGATLDAALALAVEVEALARMYWQALQLGEPVLLPAAEMDRVLEKFRDYGR
ncbi:MAG TPA: class II aldolase/adducin family protein [Burkholderiaceae bacterium]|nr:class II aldolase/adducin family protein [Burkholderiaceae bacterium]